MIIGPDKNELVMSGCIVDMTFSHTAHGIEFYDLLLQVPRLSDKDDFIHVSTPKQMIENEHFEIDDIVCVTGSIRSRNVFENHRSRLDLYVNPKTIQKISEYDLAETSQRNAVCVEGYVCIQPSLRQVSTRLVSGMMIASNRITKKADYLPIVSWGMYANVASKLQIGQKVTVLGRLQSRTYRVRDGENLYERTVSEVSSTNIIKMDGEQIIIPMADVIPLKRGA